MSSILSLRPVPPAERFAAWREAVSDAFVPLDATRSTNGAFEGGLSTHTVGPVQISDVTGGAVEVVRSPRSIRRSDPGYVKVGMQLRGSCLVTQDDKEAQLLPGDLAVYDTRRSYRLRFDGRFKMLVVMFPRELLRVSHEDLARLTARRISGRSGLGGLVSPFLVQLARGLDDADVTPTFELSVAVLDLLAAACFEHLDGRAGEAETHRHALILSVKAFIDARLADPRLTTATVAEAQHISVRYLQKLFQEEGTTASEWIRTRRLEECCSQLTDPRSASLPIGMIASQWGLVNFSHFSRLFRSTYGMSPRAFRVAQRDSNRQPPTTA